MKMEKWMIEVLETNKNILCDVSNGLGVEIACSSAQRLICGFISKNGKTYSIDICGVYWRYATPV